MRQTPLFLLFLFLAVIIFFAVPAYAGTCSNPAGKEADIVYNRDYHTYQFCNGTSWIPYKDGYSQENQSAFNPSYPVGVGFFVLSYNTYNGNLGGRSGADSSCLSDLTTNTGWKGYSTANSRGLLVSGHVHALICDNSTCNTPTTSTTYYFANAGNSSAGGASFITDPSGTGPNDSANWSAANYFSGTYNYWTGMNGGTSTSWGGPTGNDANTCQQFTVTWQVGNVGVSSSSGSARWDTGYAYGCGNSYHLICFVNP